MVARRSAAVIKFAPMSLPPPPPASSPKPRETGLTFALLVAAVLGAAAVLGVLAYRMFQPRWYAAQVVFENTPVGMDKNRQSLTPPPQQKTDPQLELLQDPALLDLVVRELNLTKEYGRDGSPVTTQEARAELRRSMEVLVNAQTAPQVVTIRVYDQDPNVVANIANTLVKNFRNRRLEARSAASAVERSLSVFKADQGSLRAQVEAAFAELTKVRERDQVTDSGIGNPSANLTGQDVSAYREAKAKYHQAVRLLESEENTLSKARMEALLDGEPVRVLQRAVPPTGPLPWWRGDPRGNPEYSKDARCR